MPHHPSLSEVLDAQCLADWMTLVPRNMTIKDWIDSEDPNGDRGSMEFFFECGETSSESGGFNFPNVILNLSVTSEKTIQELEGDFPLGTINYYDSSCPSINVNLKEQMYRTLLPFLANKIANFRLRVSIPDWQDKSAKCLPLMSYQVFYERET